MRISSLLTASVLLLTGCVAEVLPSPLEQVSQGTAFEDQQISWVSCQEKFECATVAAPLDWSGGSEEVISISLIRRSGLQDKPAMLINPGGPGSSGISYLADSYDSIGTDFLRTNFQLIGFDPRGVGQTEPVTCESDALKDKLLYDHVPFKFGTQEYLDYSNEVYLDFAKSCQVTGFSSAYFNTQQVARDMDLIRAVLGEQSLNYLGFSYGTELGANYAALFPDRVGLMVLDGAVDPTLDPNTTLLGQIQGFDNALNAYLSDCLAQSFCPFETDLETARERIAKFLRAREIKPLPTFEDRELSLQAAIAGIIVTLYSQESWQYLSQAFDEAFEGNGSTFLLLADFYNDRNPNGGYLSNITEANYAIACSDDAIWSELPDLGTELAAASSVFGRYFASDESSCQGWPEGIGMEKLDFTVALSNGPLVVGTTGDPATPYQQAVALSELLDGARLVTFEGEGHTAYGSNACVNSLVDKYLSNGELSSENLTCSR